MNQLHCENCHKPTVVTNGSAVYVHVAEDRFLQITAVKTANGKRNKLQIVCNCGHVKIWKPDVNGPATENHNGK